ncbi:MAG: Na+/H+ antiporter subunit E [Planctomycetota bacterium]
MTFIYTFFILSGFWVLMSGKFDAFHLTLGAISCLLISYLSHDLLFSGLGHRRKPGIPFRFILYIPWLLYQIVLANIHVVRLALDPRAAEHVDPRIIRFKTKLKQDMSKVTFANSITLTPGTITVHITDDEFVVHAISEKAASGLPGEMEERIARVFGED